MVNQKPDTNFQGKEKKREGLERKKQRSKREINVIQRERIEIEGGD